MDSSRRRHFLQTVAGAGIVGLAGCNALERDNATSDEENQSESTEDEDTNPDEENQSESTEDEDTNPDEKNQSESTEDEDTNQDAEAFGNGKLTVTVSPSVPQSDLRKQYSPVGDYLEDELDVETELNLEDNSSAVIQSLGAGTSNVAETGPFAAVLGSQSDNAEIVLQRQGYGSWTYASGIAVRRDSNIDELADLEGKRVAFADQLSTSGALFPLFAMKNEGGLDIGALPERQGAGAEFEALFTGAHTTSYEALAAETADAAAMGGFVEGLKSGASDDAWEETAEWLHRTDGLPRAPIVVSPELSDENQQKVVDALLEAPEDIYWGADGKEGTNDDLWFNAVREVDAQRYQLILDAANELGIGVEIFERD
jgi:phosphonate transport system substrate-binding protein